MRGDTKVKGRNPWSPQCDLNALRWLTGTLGWRATKSGAACPPLTSTMMLWGLLPQMAVEMFKRLKANSSTQGLRSL